MNRDPNCIFCKIVAGELPSIRVYEDDHSLVFMDINPVAKGHALVIPKQHWQNLYEIPDEHLGYVVATAKYVAAAVRKTLNPDGVSLTQANGKGAAQSVLHFHFHIVPRTMEDDIKINWELQPGNMDEIQSIADQIQENFG